MTPTQSITHDAISGAAKAAPALGLSTWYWILNWPVEKWVSVAVLIFTVLQIIFLIRDKVIRDRRAKRGRK